MSCKAFLQVESSGKERNARLFPNKAGLCTILLYIIKAEVRLWISVGAKSLSFVISGE
jgi:hypothetical protein